MAAASTPSSKSIVPTTSERLAGSATNGRGERARLGPAVEVLRGLARSPDAPVEAAVGEHPVELLGDEDERRDGGRVVGLVLAGVLERGRQRERLGLPAPLRARQLPDPRDRGRRERRQPQAAVGAEALLGREVVDVGLAEVGRQAARAAGRVDQDQRVARVVGALDLDHHAGRGLVVGPGDGVGPGVGARIAGRRPDRPRRRSDRRGTGRRRSTFANLLENSP